MRGNHGGGFSRPGLRLGLAARIGYVSETVDSENLDKTRFMLFLLMLVAAVVGLVASLVLSLDQLILAGNPEAELACSINSVFDCTTVANNDASKIFGIPNAFLGLMLQPVLVAFAAAMLGGSKFPKWLHTATWLMMLGAFFYAHWLLFVSTFVIHALCIWCLTLFSSTLVSCYALTRWVFAAEELALPAGGLATARSIAVGGWLEIGFVAWLAIIVVIEAALWAPVLI